MMMTPGGIGGQPQKIQSAESKKPIEQQPIDQKGTFGTRAMTWMEGVRNAFEDFMELNSSERTLEVFLETVFQPFFTSGGFKAYEEKKNILDQNYYNPPPIENNQGNPQKNIKAASTPSVQEKPSPTLEQKLEITKKKVDDLEGEVRKAHDNPILKSSKSSPEKTAAIKLYNDLTEQLQKARIELDQMEQKR